MGRQEAQASEGMWVLQELPEVQGMMGNQARTDNQDKKVTQVQTGPKGLKGLLGHRATEESLD